MLIVCCVNQGNYRGRGAEYVERLRAGVRRHLTLPHRFVEFRGDGSQTGTNYLPDDLPGWWSKLFLFRSETFPRLCRVLYLDLDTLVTGSLDEIARYDGEFACLRDFYRPDGLGSGVMAWRGGFGAEIWDRWNAESRPLLPGGDQEWIERVTDRKADRLQDLYPGQIVSFKADCRDGLPAAARLVCLHGRPKFEDMAPDCWARQRWQEAA